LNDFLEAEATELLEAELVDFLAELELEPFFPLRLPHEKVASYSIEDEDNDKKHSKQSTQLD